MDEVQALILSKVITEYNSCLSKALGRLSFIVSPKISDLTKAKNYKLLCRIVDFIQENNITNVEAFVRAQFASIPPGTGKYSHPSFPKPGYLLTTNALRLYEHYLEAIEHSGVINQDIINFPYIDQLRVEILYLNFNINKDLNNLKAKETSKYSALTKEDLISLGRKHLYKALLDITRPIHPSWFLAKPYSLTLLEESLKIKGILHEHLTKLHNQVLELSATISSNERYKLLHNTVPKLRREYKLNKITLDHIPLTIKIL